MTFCALFRYNPPKKIERLTLLKSVHIYKKHRVQYEMRTHYLCLEVRKMKKNKKKYVLGTQFKDINRCSGVNTSLLVTWVGEESARNSIEELT